MEASNGDDKQCLAMDTSQSERTLYIQLHRLWQAKGLDKHGCFNNIYEDFPFNAQRAFVMWTHSVLNALPARMNRAQRLFCIKLCQPLRVLHLLIGIMFISISCVARILCHQFAVELLPIVKETARPVHQLDSLWRWNIIASIYYLMFISSTKMPSPRCISVWFFIVLCDVTFQGHLVYLKSDNANKTA